MGLVRMFPSIRGIRTPFCRLLFCVLTFSTLCSALFESPPSMVRQPPPDGLLFQVATDQDESDKPFILECEARGIPEPTYKWFKNDLEYNWQLDGDRIVQKAGGGTLTVLRPNPEDEGHYHCEATNKYGTSVSNAYFVRRSELHPFTYVKPKEIFVDEGNPLTLSCNPPTGYPKPRVVWIIQTESGALKNINISRIMVDPEGALHFSSVSPKDTQLDSYYTCSAFSVFRNEYKLGNKITLTVIPSENWGVAPIKQYCTPRVIVTQRGGHQDIHCIFGGKPLPEIRWKKKNHRLNSSRYKIMNHGRTLRLSEVSFEDAGIYECMASNGIESTLSCATTMVVQSIPYWITVPSKTYAAEGESVRFECVAHGVPEPLVKWFVNGIELSLATPNPRRKLVNSTVLTIENLVKTDTAVYQCNASNALGYAFRDFYLHIMLLAPEILKPPKALYETVVGVPVTLHCRAIGAPQPEFKWFRDGKEVIGNRYVVQSNGDLQITRTLSMDEGRYKCIAKNKLGEEHSDERSRGHLEFRENTMIYDVPEDYEVTVGKSVTFRCGVRSDPKLLLGIDWLANGQIVDFEWDPRMVLGSDNALTIPNVTVLDSGVYRCIASTSLDNATAEATLVVKDVPNAPKIVNLECKEKSAVIEWQPTGDNCAPITSYTIQYNTSFNPDVWRNANDSIPATKLKFEVHLNKSWTNFTFGIIAHNAIGSSVRSNHSSVCRTSPDVPYRNPNKVATMARTYSNFAIFWSGMRPEEHNGPGFFYRVFWKRADADEKWHIQDVFQKNSFTLDDQSLNESYRVKVEAHNELGNATVEAEEVIVYAGEHRPLVSPQNLRVIRITNSHTAFIAWDPVPLDSIRGHLKGYKVQLYNNEEGETLLHEKGIEGNVSKAVFEFLKPFSRNYVRVRAFTNPYDGPRSDSIVITTPEGKSGPVSSLIAFPRGSTELWLTWSKPNQTNGILSGYDINYENLADIRLVALYVIRPINNPDEMAIKIDRLQPNAKYKITVRASTGAGLGHPSSVIATTGNATWMPSDDRPSFSCFLNDPAEGRTSIVVTWTPNMYHRSENQYIYYRQKIGAHWQEKASLVIDGNIWFTGFMPGFYTMMVSEFDKSDFLSVQTIEEDGQFKLRIAWPIIKFFRIMRRENNNTEWHVVEKVYDDRDVIVDGLMKGNDYEINIIKKNSE